MDRTQQWENVYQTKSSTEVRWIGDEVKDRAIVPNVVLTKSVALRDVGNDPFDMQRSFA